MAGKDVKASDGASVLKRIKISKAQKTMFAFVCGASMVVGVTAVLTVFFIQTMIFNAKVIDQKDIVAKELEKDQSSLTSLATAVTDLSNDENLRSVPTKRTNSNDKECDSYNNFDLTEDTIKSSQLDLVKRCSSLRVIPDAMPITSTEIDVDDVETTTLIQLDHIMNEAGVRITSDSDSGVSIESKGVTTSSETSKLLEPYSMLEASVNVTGSQAQLQEFLRQIDRTVRNFDLQSANIELGNKEQGDQLTFSGVYNAYYTNPINLQIQKRTICADTTSDACKKAGGDQSVKKGGK